MDIACRLSLAVFLMSILTLKEIAIGMRKVGLLRHVVPSIDGPTPRVSVVFSALNEAGTIEPALRSLSALDHPDLEIIAIKDQSTDDTGAILDRLTMQHPGLRVLHIETLPPGWLGKSHALHQGSKLASGEYVLFTDADVVFEPSAITRAVAHCEQHRLDHLVVLAEFIAHDRLMGMLLLNGMILFYSKHKPWKLRTSSKHYFGMGAFNMVRATAYRQAGGHQALALAVGGIVRHPRSGMVAEPGHAGGKPLDVHRSDPPHAMEPLVPGVLAGERPGLAFHYLAGGDPDPDARRHRVARHALRAGRVEAGAPPARQRKGHAAKALAKAPSPVSVPTRRCVARVAAT